LAALAAIARLAGLAVGAVERLAEKAAGAGLTGAAWTSEEIGVGNASCGQRVRQRLGDVLLAGKLGEAARPPFAIEDFGDDIAPAPGGVKGDGAKGTIRKCVLQLQRGVLRTGSS